MVDIDALESARRRVTADAFNRQQGTFEAETLADLQLYIQGKMGLEKYQNDLLFMHSAISRQK